MLSFVLCIVGGLMVTTGLRIGPLRPKKDPKSPSILVLPPPPPPLKESIEEDESGAGGAAKANLLSLFKKETKKCVETGHLALPNECSKYLDCSVLGGDQKMVYCPVGQLFDHLRRECASTFNAHCRGLCSNDGDEYVDPKNSNGYLFCSAGVPIPKQCSQGKKFKPETGHCTDDRSEADKDKSSDDE